MQRVVAHLDMDAFYVSCELLRKPWLRGKPVVVAGTGPRSVVTTASYEARKFGVGSAIPASRAKRLCPQAVFLPPDFTHYREKSREVMARLRAHVETVEQVGLDEAYLELTGMVAPRAAMRRLVSEIRAATGLTASVGMGPNKLVAKVASDAEKPRGFVVLTREQACARFAERAPKLIPGIGPKTADRLEAMGITTLGALAAAGDEELSAVFGTRMGPWLRRRAQFEDSGPVSQERIAVSESRETTFNEDIADRGEQQAVLRRLSEQLCEGLQGNGRRGRTIAIKVRLADFTTVTRARTIPEATQDVDVVARIACDLLAEYAPPQPLRLLGVRMAGFEDEEPAPVAAAAADDQDQMALPL
jgi:DNA polymerase-4